MRCCITLTGMSPRKCRPKDFQPAKRAAAVGVRSEGYARFARSPWAKLFRLLRRLIELQTLRVLVGRTNLKLVIICGVILMFAANAFSQDRKKDPCADAQSQAEMNICWGKEYKAADARLNSAYREFMSKLNEEEAAQLKNTQLAWLKYRDANCEFVADQFKGGSMRPMIAAMCLADVTDARAKELKSQMKGREP